MMEIIVSIYAIFPGNALTNFYAVVESPNAVIIKAGELPKL
jgi:hypothetical protein